MKRLEALLQSGAGRSLPLRSRCCWLWINGIDPIIAIFYTSELSTLSLIVVPLHISTLLAVNFIGMRGSRRTCRSASCCGFAC